MIKRDKRSTKQKIDMLANAWWASYPHYEHEAYKYKWIRPLIYVQKTYHDMTYRVLDKKKTKICWLYTLPSYNDKPKLRKGVMSYNDYGQLPKCPKEWNKIFHIRPDRRRWKRFCQLVARLQYTSYEDCPHQQWTGEGCIWDHWSKLERCIEPECVKALGHISEGIPYPSGKMHIYYY